MLAYVTSMYAGGGDADVTNCDDDDEPETDEEEIQDADE